ncbi:hypothetical protein [Lacrimispora amygdalina]|uniref:hypothetical protein n=1 Tax=Lacrimispora amygdalina TaxID=253257 RepID=UPI000BE230A1|nr:hypothetical protein [Lacrimispora amygdalina]
MKEDREFVLLRKGDRVRLYTGESFKDGTVTLGTKIDCSGCFVDYDDGTKGIEIPEALVKIKK